MSTKLNFKVIGITGTIGSGKSLVGNYLKKLNYQVIDSDEIAHEILKEPIVIKDIISNFGEEMSYFDTNNNLIIDRKKLGQVVFADKSKLEILEKLIHPKITDKLNKEITRCLSINHVFCLIPLLFEKKIDYLFQEVWTVFTQEKILLARITARDKISEQKAKQIIDKQLSQEVKIKLAKHSINNSFSKEETYSQVDNLLRLTNLD